MKNRRVLRRNLALSLALVALSIIGSSSRAFCSDVIPAQEAETQAKLAKYSINWINSLPDAEKKARLEHKPILWLHVLGNIDGFT
jgi:hypothetical protein